MTQPIDSVNRPIARLGVANVEMPRTPTAIIFGDSRVERCNFIVASCTISLSGTTATIASATGHGLWPGAKVQLSRSSASEYNGEHTVLAYVSSSSFTITVPSTYSTSATGVTVLNPYKYTVANPYQVGIGKSGGRLRLIRNAGVGGDTTADMLTRLQRDVLNYNPDVVIVQAAVNDTINDVAFATTISNLESMFDSILDSGALLLAETSLPLDPTHTSWSAARAINLCNINNWIMDYVRKSKRAVVHDAYSSVIDPTSATGAWITNTVDSNGVHQTELGAQYWGESLYNVIIGVFPPVPMRPLSMSDTYGVSSTSTQLNDNPLMQGTDGTASGGITGNVPTGYTLTETGSAAVVTTTGVSRSDGIGSDFQIVVTSTANNDTVTFNRTTALVSRVTAGDILEMEVHLVGSSITALAHIEVGLVMSITSGVSGAQICALCNYDTSAAWSRDFNLVLVTPKLVIPSGVTVSNLNMRFSSVYTGAGGGTYNIGRLSIRKVKNSFV